MQTEESLPTISHEDYVLWLDHIVTKELFKHFKNVLEMTQESRLSRHLIESAEGLYKANYLLGYVDALEDVINFSIEDEEE